MSKKLMLLAAGVLAALAFSALPSLASAKEAPLKCETGNPCTYTVHGGEAKFSLTGGDTVKCETVTGQGQMNALDANNEATTGQVQLLFHGCKEQNSPFHFACSNTATSGTITTNVLTSHNIWVTSTTQGVLLTGVNTTFTCAGFLGPTLVTGNVIGDLETACNTTGTTLALNFEATGHGQQTLKTYTGLTYDLEGKTHSNGNYETAAQTGTGTLTFNQKVVPTC